MKSYSFMPNKTGWFTSVRTWYMYEDYIGEILGEIFLKSNNTYRAYLYDDVVFGKGMISYFVSFDAATRAMQTWARNRVLKHEKEES